MDLKQKAKLVASEIKRATGLYSEVLPTIIESALNDVEAHFYRQIDEMRGMLARTANPLHTLGARIVEINIANGWNVTTPADWEKDDGEPYNKYRIPGILALIHSEISEALEAYRNRDRANFEEEMADALIRILDMTHGLCINMDHTVAEKCAKNAKRGFRHGGKLV